MASVADIHTMRASRREPTTRLRQSRISCTSAAADQDQQHQQAGDVDADDERVQVAEVRRLLHRLRHDQERSDPQARADQDEDRDERALQSRGDHVYHSLR